MVDYCRLADGTYDMTVASGGFVSLVQAINCWAHGYFGATMLLIFCIVLFSVMAFLGNPRGAYFSTCFSALLIGYIFVAIEILAVPILFVILVLNVINVMLALGQR